MRYFDIGCNIDCWKCNNYKCHYRILLAASALIPILEPITNFIIYDNLKTRAGILITQGFDFKEVNKDLEITFASLYVSRLKIREQLLED